MPTSLIKLVAFIATVAVIAGAAPANAAQKHKHAKKAVVAATENRAARGADKFLVGPLYYNGGEYLGDDPDPNIRFQLRRDLGAHFGSSD